MQLVEHIQDWYNCISISQQKFICHSLAFDFPGLPVPYTLEYNYKTMYRIFDMMRARPQSIIGYCTAFAACVDRIFRKHDNVDSFLEYVGMLQTIKRQIEEDVIEIDLQGQMTDHYTRCIENAQQLFEEQKDALYGWNCLKTAYLNDDYYSAYDDYMGDFRQVQEMNAKIQMWQLPDRS